MSLATRRKVQRLQAALHAKAKGSPGYRFYALYDKVYRVDVLAEAYEQCRQNGNEVCITRSFYPNREGVWVASPILDVALSRSSPLVGQDCDKRILLYHATDWR